MLAMPLQLKRCIIRPWRKEDADALPKYANNRNIWLRVRDRYPFPYTIDNAKEFLEQKTSDNPTTGFCIEIKGEVAGGIGVRLGEDVNRHSAEIGYWLGEPFWGQGIMTEVVKAFSDYAFANFPLRRIAAEAYANNPASARVLEKAGFQLEGRLRKHVCKDGEMLDSLVYARVLD